MKTELPSRKPLRLKEHHYSSAGAYFITICTRNRMRILSEIKPGEGDIPSVHLLPIGEVVKKYLLSCESIPGVKIDEYVIMPDHVHAILVFLPECQEETASQTTPANEMLPRAVGAFKRLCGRELGQNIFQRSYAEHVIRDRDDYLVKKRYIYENPYRWYYKPIE